MARRRRRSVVARRAPRAFARVRRGYRRARRTAGGAISPVLEAGGGALYGAGRGFVGKYVNRAVAPLLPPMAQPHATSLGVIAGASLASMFMPSWRSWANKIAFAEGARIGEIGLAQTVNTAPATGSW